ncbi:MAG: alpha/beta hydrolase domain-containing protein [Burkholderiaceae bacterium]
MAVIRVSARSGTPPAGASASRISRGLVSALPSVLAFALLAPGALPAHAGIDRLEIVRTEPAFGGRVFGPAGSFERITARAHGSLDPAHPANAGIQDIERAPRNARGRVEYVTDVEIVRPSQREKASGVLLFNITNRGNKGALSLFNVDVPPNLTQINGLENPGDGFLQQQGTTMIWFGWQGDVQPGNGRMLLKLPVAPQPDGSPITGIVRSELIARAPTPSLHLVSGWFTAASVPYPTASTDNRTPDAQGFVPVLSVRMHNRGAPMQIANSDWSFGSCPNGADGKPMPLKPSTTELCMPSGFQPGRICELTYKARDPWVMGIGFAVARDLAAFLKQDAADAAGTANPARLDRPTAIVMGSSQSGRFIRSFLHRGFNRDEKGRMVFDGAIPHIGGGLMPLDVRFAQPGRSAGTEQVDNLYPGTEFPFAYTRTTDPLTGRTQGLLDRCSADNSCPKIFHAATALEMWELRQSLGFTDALGLRDLPEPANVRSYIMASTQHASAPRPLPARAPFAGCEQQPNPNPQTWTMRALYVALVDWIRQGKEPPPSERPTLAAGNLVAPEQVKFPLIPANAYGGVQRPAVRMLATHNPLFVQDYGPGFQAAETRGVVTWNPPALSSARYNPLVAQVDLDGNDLGGIRNLFVRVPIGTYTGWNNFHDTLYKDGFCTLQGSFIPFAATREERLRTGDPRLSMAERYPDREAYVEAVKRAALDLVARRHLLAEDAARLIAEAARDGWNNRP